MPRPRRAARQRRRTELSPGIIAFLRGEPMPEDPGPDQDDYIGLEFFGDVVRGGRLVRLADIRAIYSAESIGS